MPYVGKNAPDFSLQNQDEVEVQLEKYRGKWVVLYFYPKDNTAGCSLEAQEFTEANPDFEGLEAVVLGVSPDSCKSHRNFIEKKGLGITLLSDPEHKTLELYGVWGEKKMYGKTYKGVIRTTVLIDPGGIVRERWDKVRVKGHVEAVKKRLAELHARQTA